MATDDRSQTYYCEGCRRTKRADEFYTSNNTEKYPEGKLPKCKDCVTMFVDNWDPETYLWILRELDVPYIPDEWSKCLQTWGKNREKVTGKTIIGRYISKMKLKQYRDYRWADTEYLQQVNDNKIEQAMKRQGYSAVDIDKTLRDIHVEIPESEEPVEAYAAVPTENGHPVSAEYAAAKDYIPTSSGLEVPEPFFPVEEEEDLGLTEEDKTYLSLKWGKSYKQSEWVQLEQLFNDMMNSYDIVTAGDINTLKIVCKASLKVNQLLDIGDVEGAQKMSKVYDGLMKSGKWTAAQNKTENSEVIDSIGELVALCETDHYIERYYVDSPSDKIDKVILDNQRYTFNLVNGEGGLGNMVETALKSIEREKESIEEAGEAAENGAAEEAMFKYDKEEATDEDFEEFYNFQDAETALDEML